MSDDRLEGFTEAVLNNPESKFYSPRLKGTHAAQIAFASAKELDRLITEESNLTVEPFLTPQDGPPAPSVDSLQE